MTHSSASEVTSEYKHVVLGLIFLKYISDAFEEQHARLHAERAQGADPEDPDEYRALNIFWVSPEARWPHLKAQAKQPTIGQLVDDAMAGIERDNRALKGALPRHYARRDPHCAARILEIMEEYLPLIRVRYGQKMEVNGRLYGPPEEERGVERLMTLYNRRLQDIFGRA